MNRRALAWIPLVVFLLGLIITGSSRISAVEARVVSTDQRMTRVERNYDTIQGYLQSIDQRTARIEGRLGKGR